MCACDDSTVTGLVCVTACLRGMLRCLVPILPVPRRHPTWSVLPPVARDMRHGGPARWRPLPHHACLRERLGPFPVYCWKHVIACVVLVQFLQRNEPTLPPSLRTEDCCHLVCKRLWMRQTYSTTKHWLPTHQQLHIQVN